MRRIRDLGITVTPSPVKPREAGRGQPGYFCGDKKKPGPICPKGSSTADTPTMCPAGRPTCKGPKKTESRFSSDVVLQLRQQLEAQLDD